ncbi:hypothetical protein EPI10_021363 [Gossypium australe]|uniref:Reverse transcriptase n=1 Tax=Gossypium australe TaxID=47621 RepID=A0A5B6WJD9_9ROSI|nr:hypothetical protein EPI10_021363 [Gossypium australe]
MDNYLSLPLVIGKNKTRAFQHIIDRCTLNVMASRMRSFWWEKKNKDRGWAMIAWDSLCTPKGIGGLGFRDLRLFNIYGGSSTTRIPYVIVSCAPSIFSDGDVLHSKAVDKPSFSWMSILHAVKALETGFGW